MSSDIQRYLSAPPAMLNERGVDRRATRNLSRSASRAIAEQQAEGLVLDSQDRIRARLADHHIQRTGDLTNTALRTMGNVADLEAEQIRRKVPSGVCCSLPSSLVWQWSLSASGCSADWIGSWPTIP